MLKPHFRSDLVATPVIGADGEQYVDVADPTTGKSFRFFEVEYSIAMAMDGKRSLAGVAAWAGEEMELDVPESELVGLVATLRDLGYLLPESNGGLRPLIEDDDAGEFEGQATKVADSASTAAMLAAREKEIRSESGAMEITKPVKIADLAHERAVSAPNRFPSDPPTIDLSIQEIARQSSKSESDLDFQRTTPEMDKPDLASSPLEELTELDPLKGVNSPISRPEIPEMPELPPLGSKDRLPSLAAAGSMESLPDMDDAFAPEVSVDLSDHLPVDGQHVRDAVRQSQQMPALKPEQVTPDPMPVVKEPAPVAVHEQVLKASPSVPMTSDDADVYEPTVHKKSSKVRSGIMALCLLISVAAGIYLWKNKHWLTGNSPGGSGEITQIADPDKLGEMPADLADPSAATNGEEATNNTGVPLVETSSQPSSIFVEGVSDVVHWKVKDNEVVKSGDVVAHIGNTAALEREVKKLTDKIEIDYGTRMKGFVAKKRTAKIEELKNKIAAKQKMLDRAKTKLSKRTVSATSTGPITITVASGQKVVATQATVKIADIASAGKVLQATFPYAEFTEGQEVDVVFGKDKGTCVAPQAGKVLTCDDSRLSAGIAIQLAK